jgi:uncharacterized 2Fe-2S/4Fe-4S cluster protein (DUF4445 family)
MHTVVFQPSGRRASAASGQDLLSVARSVGVEIESACGGKGKCGKCRVRVEMPTSGGSVDSDQTGGPAASRDGAPACASPVSATEVAHLGDEAITAGMRLACQTRVAGDMIVFVPEESRRITQVVRKEAGKRTVPLDPAVRLYRVSPDRPTLEDHRGDAERVLDALSAQHGVSGLSFDFRILQALPGVVRDGNWDVEVLVWRASGFPGTIIDVRPAGGGRKVLGLAVDVGTTTIAAYLTSLETGEVLTTESAMNPQVARGDDVITRLYYATHDPAGSDELRNLVVDEVTRLARRGVERSGGRMDDIYDLVMVGNTAMQHLFTGLGVRGLGAAPFVPAVQGPVDAEAAAIGFKEFNRGCRLHVLPVEAGFVGADNVGVLIAEEPYNQDDVLLIVDIGTNGEIVLGNRERMLSASCATGPALEGAHIEFGMRAAPGAIERVRIDPETLEVRFKVIGLEGWQTEHEAGEIKARGICGSGIIEAAAEMRKAGIILVDGGFDPALPVHDRIVFENGRPRKFVIARAEETAIGRAITVSLKDIRSIQLAKGALRAGAEILLSRYGRQIPDKVVLAGAFGSYIDAGHAQAIGMLPEALHEVTSVGNAAGDGARFALLNIGKRTEAAWAASTIEYVELAADRSFQDQYLKAMRF